MAVDVDASEYQALAARLRGIDRDLKARVRGRLQSIGKPIGEEVIAEGSGPMPRRGGLRAHLMQGRVGMTLGRDRVSLRLGNRTGIQLRPLNEGRLRHRVFGSDRWVVQSVRRDTYSDAFLDRRAEVAADLMDEVSALLKEVGRG